MNACKKRIMTLNLIVVIYYVIKHGKFLETLVFPNKMMYIHLL